MSKKINKKTGSRATATKAKQLVKKTRAETPAVVVGPKPLVSVVIPVYNPDHKQLMDCLHSVLNQNIDPYEVIAVNDGSPDPEVLPILRAAAKRYSHLKVITGKNAGGVAAINRGIKAASGEYLTVMDHDDIMLSGALSGLYKAAHSADADMATGKLQRLEGQADFWPALRPVFEAERVIESALELPALLRNTHYYNWIYKLDFFRKHVGLINPRIVADFEMIHKMIPNANRIAIIPQTVYLWRRTESSISSTEGFFRDRIKVISDVVLANIEMAPEYKSAYFKIVAERLTWYEGKYFELKEPQRTDSLANCLYVILADMKTSGLDPKIELAHAPISDHSRALFSMALTETPDDAVRAFRNEAITRRDEAVKVVAKVKTDEAAKVAAKAAVKAKADGAAKPAPQAVQLPAVVTPSAFSREKIKERLHKAALTATHFGKVVSVESKSFAMQYGFQKAPEVFGTVSRYRKRGYRKELQAAEGRITENRKAVMFESFLGKQFGGNPRAIYEYMLEHHPDYEFYWCYHGDHADIPGATKIVRRDSREYWEALARCQKLVNNIVFPTWMYGTKKRYLQTWHGSPLKRIGFDIHVTGPETKGRYGFFNESRNWDALISANELCSQKFPGAFRFRKEMLAIGYPANDIFYQKEREAKTRRAMRKNLALPEGAEVFLYAPTWRDNKAVGNWVFSFDLTPDFSKILDKAPAGSVVLLRQHHLTQSQKNGNDPRVIDVSNYPDAHELMVASDVLITDYSSIFFDWACSRKPVIFYTPDYDEYATKARGFYLDMKTDLNAQLVQTEADLGAVFQERRWETAAWALQETTLYTQFCKLHDGTSSQKAVEWLLRED